jgi:hypothetical protein
MEDREAGERGEVPPPGILKREGGREWRGNG